MLSAWLVLMLHTLFFPLRLDHASGSFPRALKPEEEREYLERYAAGDQEARDALIVHNLRLVAHIVKKYYTQSCDQDDLISIGTIGLIKGISTFKPDRNVRLATYASRCIENEILMFLRRTSRIKGEISLDEPLNVDWDGNELLLSDILGTEGDAVFKEIESDVEKSLIAEAVSHLPAREKLIINMRFGLSGFRENTQKQVADALGISQSYISRLEKRIIKRLQKDVSKML